MAYLGWDDGSGESLAAPSRQRRINTAEDHVEFVRRNRQRGQPVPGGDMRDSYPAGDRHGLPVGRYGQDPHQLLEVGAVVLVAAPSDRRGGFAATGCLGRVRVRPGESDRGIMVSVTRSPAQNTG